MKSVESTAEPVVCGAVDLVGSPMLADIAVALERALPLEIAVGLSQQAIGDAGSDNALGEGAVFGTEVGAVLPALSTAVRSPRYVTSPLVSTAGADVAVFCASSAVSIGGVSAAFDLVDEPDCESVDEPMGSVEGPVWPVLTESYFAPSDAGLPLVSESIVVIRTVSMWLFRRMVGY